jgi:hypothetical protein
MSSMAFAAPPRESWYDRWLVPLIIVAITLVADHNYDAMDATVRQLAHDAWGPIGDWLVDHYFDPAYGYTCGQVAIGQAEAIVRANGTFRNDDELEEAVNALQDSCRGSSDLLYG